MKRMVVHGFCLFVMVHNLSAQLGRSHHEPDLKWRSIRSDHFFVHYPEGHEQLGAEVAAICEEVYHPVSRSLDYFPGPTHVVVHTRSDIPAGVVSYLPWRMELHPLEPHSNTFGSGSDWLRLLIIHEFTHVVHLRKREGLSALAYPLFGDFTTVVQEAGPRWFTEGFATLNETRFTSGGRGRTPFHWMQMAAPLTGESPWPLENTNFASRKRAPSAYMSYVSGFYLALHVTRRYGSHIWADILDRYSTFPFLGFSHAVKSITGEHPKQLYRELLGEFRKSPVSDEVPDPEINAWWQPTLPEDQLSPRWRDENRIVFYRRGVEDLHELAEVSRHGSRRRLTRRVLTKQDNGFTLGGDVIVWSELHPHPRFTATVYSDLMLFHVKSGRIEGVTNSTRIFSPDLSPDRSRVVAVQTDLPTTRLVAVGIHNGETETLLEIPGATLMNPRWSRDGDHIALTVKDSTAKQNIAVLDVDEGDWTYLYPPNGHHDNHPCWGPRGDIIFYSSDESGVFNIWAVERRSGKRWMVTDVDLGAFTPDISPGGDELAFSMYTFTGFTLATMKLDTAQWIERSRVEVMEIPTMTEKILEPVSDTTSTAHPPLETGSYESWPQLVLPQAWFPYLLNRDQFRALCFYLTSRDALHRHAWHGSLGLAIDTYRPLVDWTYIYSGSWPEFRLRTYRLPEATTEGEEEDLWVKQGIEWVVALPLYPERNVYTTFVQPYLRIIHQSFTDSRIYRGIRLGLGFSRRAQAPRDIAPHKGLFFSLFSGWSIPAAGSDLNGRQVFSQTDVFFPGFLPHHQFHLSQRYHFRHTRNGDFNYLYYGALPLGFDDDESTHQLRLRLAYILPVVYLEWAVPILPVYTDFLDLTVFFDWGSGWEKGADYEELTRGGGLSKGFEAAVVSYLFRKLRVRAALAVFYHSEDEEWKTIPLLRYHLGLGG